MRILIACTFTGTDSILPIIISFLLDLFFFFELFDVVSWNLIVCTFIGNDSILTIKYV